MRTSVISPPPWFTGGLAASLLVTLSACSSDEQLAKETPKVDSGTGGGSGAGGAPSTGGLDGGGSPDNDAAPPAPGSNDWVMLGYNAQSTFYNTAETKITVDSAREFRVAWETDLGTNITGAPIQVGGRVYAGGVGIYCFDAASGDQIWHNTELGASSTLAYSDGKIFIHDRTSVLRALNAENGEQLWELETNAQEGKAGFSSPTIVGDLVIVGGSTFGEVSSAPLTFRGYIMAANKDTGALAWSTYTVGEEQTGASLWSSVSGSVEENRVYAGTGNNYTEPATDSSDAILALALDTGTIEYKAQRFEGDVWSLATAALGNPDFDFGTNPILFEAEVDGVMTPLVAAGQKSGDAHILRRTDGSEVATRSFILGTASGARGIFNNGAWDGKRLLFAANGATSDDPGSEPQDGYGTAVVFAIDPATANIIWERQVPGVVMAPITVANGVGFVGADQHLEAFDTATGELLYKKTVVGTIASGPTISNGRVAFGSGIGWLFGTAGSTLTVLEVP